MQEEQNNKISCEFQIKSEESDLFWIATINFIHVCACWMLLIRVYFSCCKFTNGFYRQDRIPFEAMHCQLEDFVFATYLLFYKLLYTFYCILILTIYLLFLNILITIYVKYRTVCYLLSIFFLQLLIGPVYMQ